MQKKYRKYTIGFIYLPWSTEDDPWTMTYETIAYSQESAINSFHGDIVHGAFYESENVSDYLIDFVH